eukprot:CAMPEP_0113647348 /NCGR_PEP_ID=MMETSP0017_2-20120614/25057_1 /TAXON_ID=2856 /ORGANISM="Cylindrotheca closterium" /LENGTH=383 /DNA_ID=CAMNT_0000559387 /DNA_START=69 /DNA_END=1220 /DNA_ORIENTATION=- /assembly_acc=CAM_ASM_000147
MSENASLNNNKGIRAVTVILGLALLGLLFNPLLGVSWICNQGSGHVSEFSYGTNETAVSTNVSKSSVQQTEPSPAKNDPTGDEIPISSEPKIPHRFVFNSYRDFWNVDVNDLVEEEHRSIHRLLRRSVVMFKKVWREKGYTNTSMEEALEIDFMNEPVDGVEVVFLTDKDCEELINSMEPKMTEAFLKEPNGKYRSDMCRVFSLYEKGGYYLDTDLLVHEAPYLMPHVTFATVIEPKFQDKFLQAFIAVAPKHPIIIEAINVMMEHYVTKKGEVTGESMGYRSDKNMGTWTLREAHKRVMRRLPNIANEMVLFQELPIDDYPNWFPEVPRPHKTRTKMMRFVTVNLAAHKLHFWSKGYRNRFLTEIYHLGDPPGFVPRNTTAD